MRVDVLCPKHAHDGALGQSQPGRSHWDVAPARDDGVTLSRGACALVRPHRRRRGDAASRRRHRRDRFKFKFIFCSESRTAVR